MIDILLKSIVAAIVVAIILVIAKFSSPKLAGTISSVPIIYAISYVLITMKDKSASKTYLIGGIYGAIATIFFGVVLIWFNQQFSKTHWLNFAIVYILCFLFALGLARFSPK